MHQLYPLFVAIPLGIGFIALLIPKAYTKLVELIVAIAMGSLLVMSVKLIGHSPFSYYIGKWKPPFGITFVSDGVSTLILLIISIVGFLSALYAFQYMNQYTSKIRFYTLFMFLIGGMNGVVVNGDMFNLFIFLEIATLASYSLVGYGCEHDELEASFKYTVLGNVSSVFILLGIAILYASTGTLNMADMGNFISSHGLNKAILFASTLFLMGFGLKAAMVPLHAWLPDAHPAAPAPISAMLSGVLIKACGVYALIRIFYHIIGVTPLISIIFLTLGSLSMVVGVLLAIGQNDFKRLLAYSSISQMGYIVIGIGLGTPLGILGALFHIMNHAFFKSLLFLCAGAIEYSTGTRKLNELGGLFKRLPFTSTACSVASFSIAGIPPFNGFWSKLIIIIALVQSQYYAIAAVAVGVSFLTLLTFIKVQREMFFGKLPEKLANIKEAPFLMKFSLGVLALLCIVMVALYPFWGDAILSSARQAVLDKQQYIQIVMSQFL